MGMIADYPPETKALMCLHFGRLSEKGRRQYAALEALKLPYGGTSYISRLLGIDRNTILQGKKELLEADVYDQIPAGRQRRAGGGREKKHVPAAPSWPAADRLHRQPQSRQPDRAGPLLGEPQALAVGQALL
jgi:hypothetical protein